SARHRAEQPEEADRHPRRRVDEVLSPEHERGGDRDVAREEIPELVRLAHVSRRAPASPEDELARGGCGLEPVAARDAREDSSPGLGLPRQAARAVVEAEAEQDLLPR